MQMSLFILLFEQRSCPNSVNFWTVYTRSDPLIMFCFSVNRLDLTSLRGRFCQRECVFGGMEEWVWGIIV